MRAITLSATFEGEHIRLEDDFPLPKNARLLVTILPENLEEPAFREFWRELGAKSLERGYGENEPEYDLSMVKEPNPKYGGR